MLRRRSWAALVVLIAGCSGGSSPTTASAATTNPLDQGSTVTIGADGGVFSTSIGVALDALPGSFPDGTLITVEAADAGELPPGAEALGPGFRITSPAQPSVPVVLEIPIPAGASTEDLYLLRIPDEGDPQIIGGTVVGSTFVAAVPGFSRFALTNYQIRRAVGAYGRVFTGPGWSAPTEGDDGLSDEFRGLIEGDLPGPATRGVRVVGPAEVPRDRGASYGAIDFSGMLPRFYQYSWSVYGPLAIQGPANTARLVVEPTAAGRAVVTVEATDPVLGVSAFASQRVFVLDAGEPGLYLSPDQDVYEIGGHAQVLAAPRDMTPPYSYRWSTTGGADDSESGLDGAATIDVGLDGDTVLTVTVTDATGTAVTQSLGIHVHETTDRCPLIALAGPHEVQAGEAATFRVLTSADLPSVPNVVTSGDAPFEWTGDILTVTFPEPGRGIVWFLGRSEECGELMGAHFVGVSGPIPPVEARIVDVATDAVAGDPASLTVEATGGVVFLTTGPEPYTGTIDWGDGTLEDLVIEPSTASAWNPLTVEHEYADAGDYAVTVMVSAPEGGDASATANITVSDSAGRYQGDVIEYRDADTPTFTITKNKATFVVDGDTIEWRKLEVAWKNLYEAFDLQGHTYIADCEGRGGYVLTSADLVLTAKGKVKGTAVLLWSQHDSGPDCPFGGIDADRVVNGEVSGSFDLTTITFGYDGTSDDGHPVSFTIEAGRG